MLVKGLPDKFSSSRLLSSSSFALLLVNLTAVIVAIWLLLTSRPISDLGREMSSKEAIWLSRINSQLRRVMYETAEGMLVRELFSMYNSFSRSVGNRRLSLDSSAFEMLFEDRYNESRCERWLKFGSLVKRLPSSLRFISELGKTLMLSAIEVIWLLETYRDVKDGRSSPSLMEHILLSCVKGKHACRPLIAKSWLSAQKQIWYWVNKHNPELLRTTPGAKMWPVACNRQTERQIDRHTEKHRQRQPFQGFRSSSLQPTNKERSNYVIL